MDIRVECDDGAFKLRACGVFVKDGKMLVDKSRRFDGHIFLGGHIEVGENSRDAIIREAKEEMGIDVEIDKLICISENIYPIANSNRVAHEIAYYYLLKTDIDIIDGFEFKEIDKGVEITHRYNWIDLKDCEKNNVRPNWLAKMIIEGKENYYQLTDQTKENYE